MTRTWFLGFFLLIPGWTLQKVISDFQSFKYKQNGFRDLPGPLILSPNKKILDLSKLFFLDFERVLPPNARVSLPQWTKGSKGLGIEFIGEENVIRIQPRPFFHNPLDSGSFTINFSVYLFSGQDDQVVFACHGPVLEEKQNQILSQGFKFFIKKSRLVCHFDNFFHFKNRHLSIHLDQGRYLKTHRWIRFQIIYDSLTGHLSKYRDGVLEDFAFTREGIDGSVFYPSFFPQNKHPLVIGRGFLGKLDEVSVYGQAVNLFEIPTYSGGEASFVSRVFMMPPFVKLKKISIPGSGGSNIAFWVRKSQEHFMEGTGSNPWELKSLNKEIISVSKYFDRFVQFKIIMNHPKGESGFTLTKLYLDFSEVEPPESPKLLQLVRNELEVSLRWAKTANEQVGGFHLYYRENSFAGKKKLVRYGLTDIRDGQDYYEISLSFLKYGGHYQFALTAFSVASDSLQSPYSKIISFSPHSPGTWNP